MREFCQVSPSFWIGKTGKEIARLGVDAQIVALYLLTSPHSNMIGLFWCPIMYIAHETGRGIEGATKGLESLKSIGFCMYDEENEFVWVKEMARHQVGEKLKESDNKVKGVKSQLKQLPKNNLIDAFLGKYSKNYHLNIKPLESPLKAPPKQLKGEGEGEGEGEKKSKYTYSEDDMALTIHIYESILNIAPHAKKPNYESWANVIRLMRESDKIPIEEIKRVFDWANKDGFWSTNILSTKKLREKFTALSAKANQNEKNSRGGHGKKSDLQHRQEIGSFIEEQANEAVRELSEGSISENEGDISGEMGSTVPEH